MAPGKRGGIPGGNAIDERYWNSKINSFDPELDQAAGGCGQAGRGGGDGGGEAEDLTGISV